MIQRRLYQRVGIGGFGHVCRHGDSVPAGGDNLITGCLNRPGASPGDGQIGAGTGEGPHHFQAKPGAAAGDDDDSSVQVKVFKHEAQALLELVEG